MELTPKQLLALPPQDYLLIDMRNSADREYGTIPGSVACSAEQLLQEPPGSLAYRLLCSLLSVVHIVGVLGVLGELRVSCRGQRMSSAMSRR